MITDISRRELLQGAMATTVLGFAGCIATPPGQGPGASNPADAGENPSAPENTPSSPTPDVTTTANTTPTEETPDNTTIGGDSSTPIPEPTITPEPSPSPTPDTNTGGGATGGSGGYSVPPPTVNIHSVSCNGAVISADHIRYSSLYQIKDNTVSLRIIYSDPNLPEDHIGATSWVEDIGPISTDSNGRLQNKFVPFGVDFHDMQIDLVTALIIGTTGLAMGALGQNSSWYGPRTC